MPSNHRKNALIRNALREASFVAIVWILAVTYTITYCGMFGYRRTSDDLQFVLGFPDWVFWGIIVPWVACIVIGIWFAYHFMKDEELGDEELGDDELRDQASSEAK